MMFYSKVKQEYMAEQDNGKNYWLLKTEPDVYSYANLVRDGASVWDGVSPYTNVAGDFPAWVAPPLAGVRS